MLAQKEYQFGERLFIIQEFGAAEALEIGADLGKIISGTFSGMADFGGNVLDTNIHLGKVIQGGLDRLFTKEFMPLVKRILKAGLARPDYSDDWFNETFTARRLPELYDLVHTIIVFNFEPIAELIKKKIPGIIGGTFSDTTTKETDEPND